MTDREKMEFWKGGDASEVLRFTNPYDYEGCLIGVSTDGRVVYDFIKAMEFVYEAEKDNYDISEFEDEDDLRYTIMYNAGDMLSHDLGCYRPDDKVPVFCRTDEDTEDEEFFIHDSPYGDFSTCVIGNDFREYRYIFSLSKMVDFLVKNKDFEKEAAVNYVYSLEKAGTVEDGVYNYVIVDDLFEKISLNGNSDNETLDAEMYSFYSDKYSPEFENNGFEFKGLDFLNAITKLDKLFPRKFDIRKILRYFQIKKSEDDSSAYIYCTDASLLLRAELAYTNNSELQNPLYLSIDFEKLLNTQIKDNDKVKIFEGNGYVFVKVNEKVFAVPRNENDYPSVERAIPQNNSINLEINRIFLVDFIEELEKDGNNEENKIRLIFQDNKLTLKTEKLEKSVPGKYDCEEGFSIIISEWYLFLLTMIYETDFTFKIKDNLSAIRIDEDNIMTVLMPMREDND